MYSVNKVWKQIHFLLVYASQQEYPSKKIGNHVSALSKTWKNINFHVILPFKLCGFRSSRTNSKPKIEKTMWESTTHERIPSCFLFSKFGIKLLGWWVLGQAWWITRKRLQFEELHKKLKNKYIAQLQITVKITQINPNQKEKWIQSPAIKEIPHNKNLRENSRKCIQKMAANTIPCHQKYTTNGQFKHFVSRFRWTNRKIEKVECQSPTL